MGKLQPWTLRQQQLSNGVRVASLHLPHVERPHVSLTLRGGPTLEDDDTWGLSHMVEHMVFRGTTSLPTSKDVALAFDEFGGDANAATYHNRLVFESRCDDGAIDATVQLFAEMLTQPVFEGFDVEKDIMREELLETLDDNDEDIDVDNLLLERLFAGTPMARNIEGPIDLLEDRTLDDVERFHARLVHPEHTLVLAVGNDVHDDVVQAAQLHLSSWTPPVTPLEGTAPPNRLRAHLGGQAHDDVQTEVRLGFIAPGDIGPQREVLQLLVRVLDDGPSTRIPAHLVDEQGLAYSMWASSETFVDTGVFELGADVHHKRVADVVQAWCALLRDVCQHGVGDDELARAKRRMRRDVIDAALDPEGIAESMQQPLLYGLPFDPHGMLQRAKNVTSDDIRTFAQGMCTAANARVAFVGRLTRKQKDLCKQALATLE